MAFLVACGGKFADGAGTGSGGADAGSSGGAAGTGGSAESGGSAGTGGVGPGGSGGQSADASVDWGACDGPGQCVLLPAGCCGTMCEPTPLSQFVGVNAKYIGEYGKRCELVDCAPPACPVPPPGGPANVPFYTAVCQAGRCTAVDIRQNQLTACTDSTQCFLRWGAECCQICGGGPASYGIVAFSKQADIQGTLCGSMFACDACAPPEFPDDVTAVCNQTGHCDVLYGPPTMP
jgi:hypothetical protein